MDISLLQKYLIPILVVAFIIWRFFKNRKAKIMIPEYLTKGAIIIDVRNPEEFSQASNPKSINIPLNVFEARMSELDKKKPVIVCCAAGGRSAIAEGLLKNAGFDVINAGPWGNTVSN